MINGSPINRDTLQFSYTSVAGYDETVPLIHAKYVTK
jgi:hypothetical protein